VGVVGAMLTYTELRALDRADSAPFACCSQVTVTFGLWRQLGNVIARQRHCLGAELFT